ncbi:MAG: hypothetical protein K2X87_11920 [Gemmataceae bacterium]|nr:hypothetical protein [Gemmataceae bacterium]
MVQEIMADHGAGVLYLSPRLSAVGRQLYPDLFRAAAESHDMQWLATELNRAGRLKTTEERLLKNKAIQAKVPHNAAETLAEGEFNRFYVRGLCRFVLEGNPEAEVEVYRAKDVADPRPESEARIGERYKAVALLEDLRTSNNGIDVALGVPAGPNSGLSVRIPGA